MRRAFTLLELSVVLTLLLVTVAVVVPRVGPIEPGRRERAFWAALPGVVISARTEAIQTDAAVTVKISQDQTSIDLGDTPKLTLLSGVELAAFKQNGQAKQANDWELNFYPDGTADTGGVTFRMGDQVKSLSVDAKGVGKLTDGELPDDADQTWSAGEYEKRA